MKYRLFVAISLGVFLLLWGLEHWLDGTILHLGKSDSGYLASFLANKIESLGAEEARNLIPQIKIRWLAICFFSFYLMESEEPKSMASEKDLRWRIRLFFGIQLVYLPDLMKELSIRWQWKSFYEPALIPRFLFREMPSVFFLQFGVLFCFAVGAYFLLSKWKHGSSIAFVLSVVSLLCWTIFLFIYMGGGNIDHTYASMYSAMIFMSVWLLVWWKNPSLTDSGHRLFQAGIWGCYFFSGLEKLFLSGSNWLDGNLFKVLCQYHTGRFCDWFAQHPLVSGFALCAVLAFQLLSPLQWRFPRWGYVTAGFGLFFHLGTWLVLDIGGWQSPWLVMLLFLLPLNSNNSPAEEKSAI